jgi:hypothetical protein
MRVVVLFLIAGLTPLLGGCRTVTPVVTKKPQQTASLESVPRQLLLPDVSAATVSPVSYEKVNDTYSRLTADDCSSLACQNSSIANLLESGMSVKTSPFGNRTGKESAEWVRVVTARHLSQEARNRSAGAALAIYYKLLEAELKTDIIGKAIAELDELIRANNTLAARGFKQTADSHDLEKQKIELLADRARLRAGIRKGNAELKSLLAIDPNMPGFLLPFDQIKVVPEPLDADQAVQVGLMQRADLNLIRSLTNMLDHHTLVAVRHALVGLAPGLSAVQSASEVLFPPLTVLVTAVAKAEAAIVKKQLQGLLRDREREATKDIRSAVDEWHSARDLVVIARQRVELCAARVTEYEKKSKNGFGVELELRKANLEALKADGDLITEVIRWKLADVKVREEIGLHCCKE